MKQTIKLLSIALFLIVATITRSQVIPDPAPVPIAQPSNFLQSMLDAAVNDVTNWYAIPYAIYAPEAVGDKWGYGICLARPVSEYVVLDLRIEGEPDSTIYGVSGSVSLQLPLKTFGVKWMPFTYVGVGQPMSGEKVGGFTVPGKQSDSDTPVAIYGYGVAFKFYQGEKFSAGLVADVEYWADTPQTYRFGPMFNYKF